MIFILIYMNHFTICLTNYMNDFFFQRYGKQDEQYLLCFENLSVHEIEALGAVLNAPTYEK